MTQGIILAAGMGRRMRGRIGNTPKSLLKVGGKPLIERNIDYMVEAGFDRIVVVVGYERERFTYLRDKYEKGNLELVENEAFATSNTISSLYEASRYFDEEAFITTADILLRDNLYLRYAGDCCFYLLRPVAEYEKPDWIAELDSELRFVSVDMRGTFGHAYSGISHWTVEGLEFIREQLEEIDWSSEDERNRYWDELLLPHLGSFDLRAQILESNDLVYEFDDIDDMRFFESEQREGVLF